jgi:hypothetical protein
LSGSPASMATSNGIARGRPARRKGSETHTMIITYKRSSN